ncbi:MAG: hypothetical protein ABIW76_17655, partial [Fibrobacteria bacterium]
MKTFFNLDYGLTQSIMPVFGIMGSIFYIVFHFTEKAMGFSDSISLRIVCVGLSFSLLFWPRDGRFKRARIVYWELSIAFLLPVYQTFLFLINPTDPYWASSNLFWSFFLGISTKGLWLPIHLVLGQYLGVLLTILFQGSISPGKIHDLMDQQLIITCTAFSGLGIKLAMEVFHRRGTALAGANARAAEAESREAEISAAYSELKRREEVIQRFVRPSILEELRAGQNPTEFKPVHREL